MRSPLGPWSWRQAERLLAALQPDIPSFIFCDASYGGPFRLVFAVVPRGLPHPPAIFLTHQPWSSTTPPCCSQAAAAATANGDMSAGVDALSLGADGGWGTPR